ncbi:MAG TPA: tRNA epoxyqueuosine(34) reductase QueG [Oligoflexia bacterium]|nr:tRNA epoxyqueuosine(34) reductase QueG [Oligoflexia bacterium]HMP49914.1 tRNA epoxyqueuosine(34) reductase QueG [Oligoflexia bacterium]
MSYSLRFDDLKSEADSLGFQLVSCLSLKSSDEALSSQADYLANWQNAGYAAEMKYMKRPVSLFTDLRNFLPEIKSVLVFIVPYSDPKQSDPECKPGYGKVARYARGKDYHIIIKEVGRLLGERIRELHQVQYRVFTDAVPLLERSMAVKSDLGFQGKSTMLIRPGLGTYTFIGELLLDREISGLPEGLTNKYGCGACSRCITKCPTKAFVSPYVLDAKKCISWLTIEKRDSHNEEESRAIGNWIFGCDVCQEVCPFNSHGKTVSTWKMFSEKEGVGPFINLSDIINIRDDKEFRSRFFGTPILRAGREGMIRNALSVLANQGLSSRWREVISCFHEDKSSMVRSQARQTLNRFLSIETGVALNSIRVAIAK